MLQKPSKRTETDKYMEDNHPFVLLASLAGATGTYVAGANLISHLASGSIDPLTTVALGAATVASVSAAVVFGKKLRGLYAEAKAAGIDDGLKVLGETPSIDVLNEAKAGISAMKADAMEDVLDRTARISQAPQPEPSVKPS